MVGGFYSHEFDLRKGGWIGKAGTARGYGLQSGLNNRNGEKALSGRVFSASRQEMQPQKGEQKHIRTVIIPIF
jgi:hypothetical protein